MNVALYIAKRYLFSKSSSNAINIMSVIASGGVIIATMALFIVLSVFAGLKTFSLQFTSFIDPDLKLLPTTGKTFTFTALDKNKLQQIQGVKAISKTIEERVIIKSENKSLIASLKAVDTNYTRVTSINKMVTRGHWLSPNTNQLVSGWGISNTLAFGLFNFKSPLSLYVPKAGKGQIQSLNSIYNVITVNNVGLLDINETMNNQYVFASLNVAQNLLQLQPNTYTALELKLAPNANANKVKLAIQNAFKNKFEIKNRAQLNDALYKMLNTENAAIYLIFTLVIIIALFNVIGAIIMMILDKQKSLKTLYNIGAETKTIKKVFLYQGVLMALISGVIGVVLGLIIVGLQQAFDLVMITPQFAYPVEIKAINIIIVLLTIFLLGFIASKLATQRVSKTLITSS